MDMIIFDPIKGLLSSLRGKYAEYKAEVIKDYWICLVSRECSIVGRKEVLTGKAKFGILGDGKEVPQVAMARAFKKGDFRSGYYRDQTFMMALGICSVKNYFAQLYADFQNDPFSKGRQMNAHFASRFLEEDGEWMDLTKSYNISADISSTAGQMARALGLALASKLYRQNPESVKNSKFSNNGNEVTFCTIGDASTSEGVFWETINAAGVLQVPLAVSVWDDGYGISVPIELQTTKQSISEALSGFEENSTQKGIKIYTAKAWNYPELVAVYKEGIDLVREHHIPALFHIQEVTQPQGHSTSGSHERYKTKSRMEWEENYDCIKMMKEWLLSKNILELTQLEELKEIAKQYVIQEKQNAWNECLNPILKKREELVAILQELNEEKTIQYLMSIKEPGLQDLVEPIRQILFKPTKDDIKDDLKRWFRKQMEEVNAIYHSHLYSESQNATTLIPEVAPIYTDDTKELNGYQILNLFFDQAIQKDHRIIAFGEDVGKIGDVNQGFAGLQSKYGESRIFDTGIREWTIVGQAIGCGMRGFRPIAEIQYLDYIVYGLSPLMDDLATLRYRSAGQQASPAIIRTRGHRLEGIWHSGSPIGMLINSLRGMYLCVPRNMTQAAGMYNTLFKGDDPAVVIECLNGYRLKEKVPDNLSDFTVPLGKTETIIEGIDLTLVSYGSCIRVAQKAAEKLLELGIQIELIDVQTLLPFDLSKDIVESIKKTNKLIVLDEDVPGGASAYILQQILEVQKGFQYLDSNPVTITAKEHRSPYGSTGDYFTKPGVEDVIECVIEIMEEYQPGRISSTN